MSLKQILTVLLGLTAFTAVAQSPQAARTTIENSGNTTIYGIIIDSVSNKPVEYAAIALWDATKAIDGTLTEANGTFKFQGIKPGIYKLIVSYIGYKPTSAENIRVTEDKKKLDVGHLKLVSDNIQLQEVTVTGQAALVEDKIDRLVYNAEKDITNRGGTAEEVLRKVPMLSVDLDGNVELRGSQNVKILINNKPSSIFASSVGEALQQIPADQIKSIEVITSPGARYESEGTAGIVNIILKKNTLAGVTGSISAGVGYTGSNGNGSVNVRDKKWGISANGGGRYSYNFRRTADNTRHSVVNGVESSMHQTEESRGIWNMANHQTTFDYNFDENNNMTITYSGRSRGSGSNGDQITELLDSIKIIKDRDIDQKGKRNSNDLDFTFQRKYKNPVQELRVSGQYSQSNNINNFTASANEVQFNRSQSRGIDREYEFRLDYVQPLTSKIYWEMGGRTEFGKSGSTGRFYDFNPANQAYILNDRRSNELEYLKNEYAAYSSFTIQLPEKWGLQAGLRYEKTTIDATFSESGKLDILNYNNLLPSIILSKKLAKGNTLKASFTQRLQRPSIRYLNPYRDYSNVNEVSFGNPTLLPERIDLVELGYSTFFGNSSLNFSLFSRFENNSITEISNINTEDGVVITETTYDNVGKGRVTGLDISFSLNPTSKLRIGGGLDPSFIYLDNGSQSNSGFTTGLHLNSSYSFEKGWAASFFGFYRPSRVLLQGRQNGFSFYGLSVKKDINKRGSLGLGIENPFTKAIRFTSKTEDYSNPLATFVQENNGAFYRRSIRIDFQYRFGKLENDGRSLFNRRRRIDNTDDKREDNSQEM